MKTKKRTSNRDIVLRTATALFLEKGYALTSMDDIVAASKVSKTNIYYHFKSKEELLAAIVTQMTAQYTGIIEEIASQTELSVIERITAMTKLLFEQPNDILGGCPFLTLYVQTSREADFVREEIGRFFQNQIILIERLLQEGINNHEFRADLPIPQTAVFIVSTIEGGMFLQQTRKKSAVLPDLLQALAFMLK